MSILCLDPNSNSTAKRYFLNLGTFEYEKDACVCFITQPCPILCDPMDCSLPGSADHGNSPGKDTGVGCRALLQGMFPPRDRTQVSHIAGRFFTIWVTREAKEYWSGVACPFSRGEGEGCHALLQGIFPTQRSNQVSCIASRFWFTRELDHNKNYNYVRCDNGTEVI